LQQKADKTDELTILRELNADGKKGPMRELAAATELAATEAANEDALAAQEWGDKPTKNFFSQVKSFRASGAMHSLYKYDTTAHDEDTSVEVTAPQDVADSLAGFYTDLYSQRPVDQEIADALVNSYTHVTHMWTTRRNDG
jgi:hypothetical protein